MSTKSGRAPAWEMASAVAMKVRGTVTTVSPRWTPAAMSAKRRASVPLAMPTQKRDSQNWAKSRSNSWTMGPPMNPAVSRAALKTESSSSRRSRWTVRRSRKGTSALGMESTSVVGDIAQEPRGVAGDDAARGHVAGDDAAGPDDGILADNHVGQDRRPRPDGGAVLHQRGFHLPVVLGLELARAGGRPRVGIVDEGDAVPDEDAILDRDAFADEGVAGNLAVAADLGV